MNAIAAPVELQTTNPGTVFECFETEMAWSFGDAEAEYVTLRAWYTVAFSSVYDRGRGCGSVIVHRVECDNSCTREPLWERVKLPDVMVEALEREIREEVGVCEEPS